MSHSLLTSAIKAVHAKSPCIFKMPADMYVASTSQIIRMLLAKYRDMKTSPHTAAVIRARVLIDANVATLIKHHTVIVATFPARNLVTSRFQ